MIEKAVIKSSHGPSVFRGPIGYYALVLPKYKVEDSKVPSLYNWPSVAER